MAVVYRTAGAWGAGEGVNLTPAQVDANFYDLATRLLSLETDPPEPVNIDHFVVAGNQFTIVMADATVHGPFTLPTAVFRFTGEFVGGTAYSTFDLFTVADVGLFLVLVDNEAPTFDPAATDDSTEDLGPLYQKVFGLPVADPGGLKGVDEVSDATYTPVLEDNGRMKLCTSATGCDVTLPAEADVDFPLGASLSFEQENADDGDRQPVRIAGDDGVNVDWPGKDTLQFFNETAMQYSVVTAIKKASDSWVLVGHLSTETATE